MGDDYSLRMYSRTWQQRFRQWLAEWIDTFKTDLDTETGLAVDLKCPNCNKIHASRELLKFGNIYEFTCPDCETMFVVTIPVLQIRKGRIEGNLNGESTRTK